MNNEHPDNLQTDTPQTDTLHTPSVVQTSENPAVEPVGSVPEAFERLPGLGRSFGWMALFFFAYFVGVIVYLMGYGVVLGVEYAAQGITQPDQQAIEAQIQQHLLSPNGLVGVYLMQCLILIPLVFLASNFQRQSWRETLMFKPFAVPVLGYWVLVWLGFFVVETVLSRMLDVDPGDFMRTLSGTRHLPVTLILIICAPLLEELIFRGYLFKAWRHSRLGLSGTLLLTSMLFTMLHAAQYNWIILAMIFALSVILGLAREKSGSIWVPIIIHSLNNFVAAVTVVYFGWL